jgi:DNA-binding CsgD family transcriptional regulator
VASLALIPLIAAGWLFSRRAASGVAVVAAALFTVSLVAEARNRPTLIIVGAVTVVVVAVARLYAFRLVALMGQPENPGANDNRVADFFDRLPRGIDSLTRRELDVARLAAEGRRAAEISADLHISARTVESHLASIYSKLGINSKTKLVRMASALPADPALTHHR